MESSRIAIVTGATRLTGIGASIAAELAADGWSLLITGYEPYDRTQRHAVPTDGLQAVADRVSARTEGSARVEAVERDLRDPEAAEFLLDVCSERLGPPLALVNNAVVSEPGGIDQIDGEQLDRHWVVNARAPMLLAAAFARAFRKAFPRDGNPEQAATVGSIVNLSSGQSAGPMPGELAYAASKGALEAFTTSAAAALAPHGIRVNAVDPGPTDTGWMTERQREALVAPLGRVGLPEDAARLVRYLCSNDSRWITGQLLRSRGGL